MGRLTDTRLELAAALRDTLTVPVYDAPPTTPAPPCVIVRPGPGHASRLAGRYAYELDIVLLGPNGDNEAGIRALEDLIEAVLPAVRGRFGLRPGGDAAATLWDAPGRASVGTDTVPACTITVLLPVAQGGP